MAAELTFVHDPAPDTENWKETAQCNLVFYRLFNVDIPVYFQNGSNVGVIGSNDANLSGIMELADGEIIMHFNDEKGVYADFTVSEFLGATEFTFTK